MAQVQKVHTCVFQLEIDRWKLDLKKKNKNE